MSFIFIFFYLWRIIRAVVAVLVTQIVIIMGAVVCQ